MSSKAIESPYHRILTDSIYAELQVSVPFELSHMGHTDPFSGDRINGPEDYNRYLRALASKRAAALLEECASSDDFIPVTSMDYKERLYHTTKKLHFESNRAERYRSRTRIFIALTIIFSALFVSMLLFRDVATVDTAVQASITQRNYIASVSGDKYHRLSCTYAERILDENAIYYETEEQASDEGKSPCSVCNP